MQHWNDIPSRFTPLGKGWEYDQYIICGIETKLEEIGTEPTHNFEEIACYHLVRLLPDGRVLHADTDFVECEGNTVIDTIIKCYTPCRRNLVICNNSLVFIGSSDFIEHLERETISLTTGKVSETDLGRSSQTIYDTANFIVSAPPTIVTFKVRESRATYTIIDIANWGMRYLNDLQSIITEEEREAINRYCWSGHITDNSVRNTCLMARYVQEYYKVCKRFDLGTPTVTYAGQALRSYRKARAVTAIKTHSHDKARLLESQSYGLGRGEARYHGYYKGDCYLLDINSLYPYLGATRDFPYELADYQESPPLSTVEEWCKDSSVILHGRIRTEEPAYRCNHENRVIFPVGEFNGFLSGDECIQAIRRGELVCVYRAARYHHGPILRDWSRGMLAARSVCKANGNQIASNIIKCITNGLWGRLATPGSRWVIQESLATGIRYGGYVSLNRETGEQTYYRVIDGVPSKLEYCHFADNIFPAISSVMNGYSRELLWKLITCCGKENVLYAAIDGLICTALGLSALKSSNWIQGNLPGMLRIVENAKSCYIACYGKYWIGEKTAYVGMPRNDRFRTWGFWNQRASDVLGVDSKPTRVVRHGVAITPTAARQQLSKMQHVKGRAIGPTSIYQPPLERSHSSPVQVQPVFQFAAYGK